MEMLSLKELNGAEGKEKSQTGLKLNGTPQPVAMLMK
jgi:hypothetical protein